jgi:hypothetical protein
MCIIFFVLGTAIRLASPNFTVPFVYQWAFVICAWQILTVVSTDFCFLLKALIVQKHPKILSSFFVFIATTRSVCIFCAYFFSLTRFWDRETWLANDYPTLRLRFDTSANILGLCYNLVMSIVFIYEIAKTVRSKEDRLYSILLSAQISLVVSLLFETVAVIIMLLVKDDYVFIISDIARAIKTFAVPCQIIQGFMKQESTGSKTSKFGASQIESGFTKSNAKPETIFK